MSNTILRPKTRQEWLTLRENGIGSSEVGTILGLNPFETPYQLWRRKKGIDPAKPQNFAMRAGHYLEDAVSRFYQDETDKEIIKSSAGDWIIRSDAHHYMQVSPDRTFWIPGRPKNGQNKGILECKTTQMQVDPDSVPQHWFAQLQYQLGVAELEQGALAWLTMGREFGYRDFVFDPEFFDYIAEEVTRFWVDNIQGGQEPLLINVDDVLLRNPRHVVGKTVTADAELIENCATLKEIKEELSSLDTRKKELEAAIKMAMGDAEALVSPSDGRTSMPQTLATWKATKGSKKFDEKRFAADMPDTYAKYLYERSGSRMFLLK